MHGATFTQARRLLGLSLCEVPMSWFDFMALVRAEAGPEIAARIEARCKRELGGVRLTICAHAPPSDAEIQAALRQAGFNVARAAKALGVDPATLYRRLSARLAKPKPLPPKIIR